MGRDFHPRYDSDRWEKGVGEYAGRRGVVSVEVGGEMKQPEEITVCWLNVICMPNGEIICRGKTVGWWKDLGKYLKKQEK